MLILLITPLAVTKSICPRPPLRFVLIYFLFPSNRAISEYLSLDLPYKLSPDDTFVTSGCTQAIDVALSILARPGVNILLPKPCFPIYELCAAFRNLEIRHYDLLPNRDWEVDLDDVEALADQNTVAMVIINPGETHVAMYILINT